MSKSDLVVLGFLNYKPMHGYEMIQWMKIHHIDRWADVKQSSIYNSLKRLQKQNMIEGEQFFDGNNPPKVIFSIKKKGIQKFRTLLRSFLFSKKCSFQDFWLATVMIKNAISQADFLEAVTIRLERCQKYYDSLIEETSELKLSEQEIPYYDWCLINYGIESTKLEINSLNDLYEKSKVNDQYFLGDEKS